MDAELPAVELGVERRVVAERNIRDGEVEAVRRQHRLLERLGADLRAGVKHGGQPGGERVDLDARELGTLAHAVRHSPKEVPEPAGGLEDAPVAETEPVETGEHGAHHDRRGVVSVEHRRPRRDIFVVGQQLLELPLLGLPLRRLARRGEDLRQAAPADILHENGLLGGRGGAALLFEGTQQLDRDDVAAELLLRRTLTEAVGIGDPVVVAIPL